MSNRKTLVFRAGSHVDGRFGDDNHTSWQTFEHFGLGSKLFTKIHSNKLLPKRKEISTLLEAKSKSVVDLPTVSLGEKDEIELVAWEAAVKKIKELRKKKAGRSSSYLF